MEHYCLQHHLEAVLKMYAITDESQIYALGFFSQVSNIILMGLISVHY